MGRVSVGIGLREPYVDELLALDDRGAIDVLEVMIDEAMHPGPKRDRWRRLGAKWPLVAHGTELGIADAEGPREDYLAHLHETAKSLHLHWYSEHLAFLRAGGIELGHFGPFFDDEESLEVLARNAARVVDGLGCPLLLENPADVLGWAGEGDEDVATRLGRCFDRALRAANCGALLDLTNLLYNARNEGYDARGFLEAMDAARVVEIHLAGGKSWDGLWIDSHDHAVEVDALALLRQVLPRATNLRAIIVERDDRLPELSCLLEEVAAVRAVVAEVAA
ncbi:MAG: DUF692 family protein [Polyangiaceae bacterium]